MTNSRDAEYYRRRQGQELKASQMAEVPEVRSLHWAMARRYADLAEQASARPGSPSEPAVQSRRG